MLNLYVTSTNINEGKTFLTAGLAATMQSLGYKTSVYKPIQTGGIDIDGFMQAPDITMVKSMDPYIDTNFTYLFKSKTQPLIAAEDENEFIDVELINTEYQRIIAKSDCTIVDGDNGLLSPIAPNQQTVDMLKRLQIPVLIVVSPSDDTINNTLASIYAAQDKGLVVRGVIINKIKDECPKELLTSITRVIEEYTNITILGLLPYLGVRPAPEEVITAILNGVDIESVFNVKIEKLELS